MAKKFKFSLDALMKYREQRLLMAKRDLATVNARYNKILEKIDSCNKEAKSALSDALSIGTSAADFLLGASLHGSALLYRSSLEDELAQVSKDLEKHREWVTHLSRELKAVEKLEEKQRDRHESEAEKKEKHEMDDWVSERWGRFPVARVQK